MSVSRVGAFRQVQPFRGGTCGPTAFEPPIVVLDATSAVDIVCWDRTSRAGAPVLDVDGG